MPLGIVAGDDENFRGKHEGKRGILCPPQIQNGTKSLHVPPQSEKEEVFSTDQTESDEKKSDLAKKSNTETQLAPRGDDSEDDESTASSTKEVAATTTGSKGVPKAKGSPDCRPCTDLPSCMGVIGRSGFQSAETYLVSRLSAVMEEAKHARGPNQIDKIFL